MKVVNQPIMKKDAMALVTGKPVFTNDKAPKECLIVKLLRSPYANAMIKSINTQFAMKVPGIEAIYTWEDVPQERFTMAGQLLLEKIQGGSDKETEYLIEPKLVIGNSCKSRLPLRKWR